VGIGLSAIGRPASNGRLGCPGLNVLPHLQGTNGFSQILNPEFGPKEGRGRAIVQDNQSDAAIAGLACELDRELGAIFVPSAPEWQVPRVPDMRAQPRYAIVIVSSNLVARGQCLWLSAVWPAMHGLDRHDDPKPGIGPVIVAAFFQRADLLARFCNCLVTIPIEMQVRGAQNIEIRDRHDQAVTVFRW
jgi:hypothetical protein